MFKTVEIRENNGKFEKVSDNRMTQMGIERMGICQACGHSIKEHFGVYHFSTGYIWVGSECHDTLTSETKNVQIAHGEFTSNGKEMIALSKEQLEKLVSVAYKGRQSRFGFQPRGYVLNEFVGSVVRFAESNLDKAITKKQFNAIQKYL